MSYKTHMVRDLVSHRSYPVRKCDIAYTEAWDKDGRIALVLKHPVRRGNCEFNRNSVIVSKGTMNRLGLYKLPC